MVKAAGLFLQAIPLPTPSATPSVASFGGNVVQASFLLSTMVWVPVVVALVLAVVPNPRGRYDRSLRLGAFWTNFGLLLLCLVGYTQFQVFSTGLQFEEKVPWMPAIGATYHLGVDGISIVVLLLSSLIGVIAVIASAGIRERVREYFVLLLLLQSAANGVIVAHDLFVLVLFWSAAALPLALLVVGWSGGGEALGGAGAAGGHLMAGALPGLNSTGLRRLGRLLGYWGLGSAALAAAAFVLYQAAGGTSFDFDILLKAAPGPRVQVVVGILLVIAAATRLPLFPFHSWIREVLAEAPVGVAVLVAGSVSRLGGYLLVRVLAGAEHDGARLLSHFIAALAAITVVYAAVAAWRSADVRRGASYLALIPGAITVLGVVGLTPLSLDGAVISLLAGGLAAALVVGAAASVSHRAQSTSLSILAGLATRMPKLAWLWLLGGAAILGLPFLATFPAEVMIVLGSFQSQPWAVFAVAVGLLLAAGAIAWVLYRVLFGAPNPEAPGAGDASISEAWYLGLLAAALLWVGILPSGPKLGGVPFFDPGVANVVNSATSDLAAPFVVPAR